MLDINVLVAILWDGHVHHLAARAWWTESRARGWASCPMTQLGCAHILALPSTSHGQLTVAAAVDLVIQLAADIHHTFWPDSIDLQDPLFAASLPHIQGHNQLTDRYLLALAAANGGALATFDRSIDASLPRGSPLLAHLELIPS